MSRRGSKGTTRGVLAVLCVAATFAVSGGGVDAAPQAAPPRAIRWLAGGDSYSAGHGTPGEQGACRRNDLAWPKVAQAQAGLPLSEFRFVACSGNVTGDLWTQSGWQPERHEVYDLVTFSFGGNDIGFADVIRACVLGGLGQGPNPFLWGSWTFCPTDGAVRRSIDSLAGSYRHFLTEVANHMVTRGGNIVVVGYPAVVEDPSRWTGTAQAIDLCNGITDDDARLIRGWAGHLNATIGQAVADTTGTNDVAITFVNIQDGAGTGYSTSEHLYEANGSNARHNLCGTDSWLNGLEPSDGYHPDLDGHQHTGRLVASILTGLDWSRLDGGGHVDAPTDPGGPPGTPPTTVGGDASPPPTDHGPLAFAITGTCTTSGGVLRSTSSGFTPGGGYTITAFHPDGRAYGDLTLGSSGVVRSDGSIAWQWDCTGDSPGTYSTELVDSTTGRRTGRVPFTVGAAAPPPTPSNPPPATARTFPAQQGSRGANTFTNPTNASGQGPRVEPMSWVDVACKLLPASTIASAYPDGYWYRLASPPWNGQYYAVANTFWNGDVPGQLPYTHPTDYSIPDC